MLRTRSRGPPPTARLQKLTIKRGNTTLLEGIDWEVHRGQHWAILGPNGSGKTSLIRTLTGYLALSSGEMKVFGRSYGACDWRDLRPKIGFISHTLHASIPPAETALETVVSGKYAQLDLWKTPSAADRRAARRHLEKLGIATLWDRPWLYLSQGERQKVMIGRALMARPKILLLDEPCSGLDPVARHQLLASLPSVAAGTHAPSLILITHHVEEITPIFGHVLILREGKAVARGPLEVSLTSQNLSAAFDHPISVRRRRGLWTAHVKPATSLTERKSH